MTDIVVHTVEARGNIMLDVLQGFLGLSDAGVRRLIVEAVGHTTRELAERGVDYSELGPVLTPQTDRREIALIFDIERIGKAWYGLPVHSRILSLLGKNESHSVLAGDLIGNQSRFAALLSVHLRPAGRVFPPQSGTAYYCVYLNNCSQSAVERIQTGLSSYPPYIGYVDTTYQSDFKTALSAIIGTSYVQRGTTIIQQHPDDAPSGENENTVGYDFEGAGFTNRSIPSMHFGLLLSYKIERPVLPGYERDQRLTLAAVTSHPKDIADCAIEIDERKVDYLHREKTGSLKRIGLLGVSRDALVEAIRDKLRSNYLYSLRFRSDFSVASFNLALEFLPSDSAEPARAVAAFAYEPERGAIRLITLF